MLDVASKNQMKSTFINKIILGCGNFGGVGSLPSLRGFGDNQSQSFHILDLARRLHINKFDTANTYGGGLSETYLGQWLRIQGPGFRDSVELHSKVGNPYGIRFKKGALSEMEIDFHVEKSLNRLQTDFIDLYYIHEPDALTPIEESVSALLKHISAGKIRKIGLSNVSDIYVKKFLSQLRPENFKYFFGVQNEFNYLQSRDTHALLPLLKHKGFHYISFSPLAGGLLTGKYTLHEGFPKGSRLSLRAEAYQSMLNREGFEKISNFNLRAKQKHIRVGQEALHFILDENQIDFVVIGPRNQEHYESLGFKFS